MPPNLPLSKIPVPGPPWRLQEAVYWLSCLPPVTEGQKEATLRLSSNDLDESPLNILLYGGGVTPQPGDLNLDWKIDLADALIALQVMVSRHPELSLKGDVSNDDRINMVDVLYIIQVLADLREE